MTESQEPASQLMLAWAAEERVLDEEVGVLSVQLTAKQDRLKILRAARAAVQLAIGAAAPVTESGGRAFGATASDTVRTADSFTTSVSGITGAQLLREVLGATDGGSAGDRPVSLRQRIKSPNLVADIVNEADKPLSRAEILEELYRRDLVPGSWERPDTAVSTAVSRARDRGLITEISSGRFGPSVPAPDQQPPVPDGRGPSDRGSGVTP